MTVQDFLDITMTLSPSTLDPSLKLRWLSEVEGRVKVELLGESAETLQPIDESTPRGEELVVPHPYDRLYWMYYVTMYNYLVGDSARYENAALLFNEAYNGYGRYLKRRGNEREV